MNMRSVMQAVLAAAVVLVLFPLLAAGALMTTHFGFELIGGPIGAFGEMGPFHVIALGWTLSAFVVVLAMCALLMRDMQHA